MASVDEAREWTDQGTSLCERALADLGDAALSEPSALPGWSRAHVVAHLTGNARALTNLTTWARTGVETPMYASNEQRNADIEALAALTPAELRVLFAESAADLAAGWDALDDAGWAAEVRTIQGRTIPASEIPWLRSREVLIHAADLDAGVSFDQFPEAFLVALVDDIAARRSAIADHPGITLQAAGRTWVVGDGAAIVTGSLPAVAAYLTGRAALGPAIPAWL